MSATFSESGQLVSISVKDQDDEKLFFKISRNKPIKKMLMEYCKKRQVEYRAMQFLVDGNRLPPNQTPDELNLEDGAEILAMKHMTGGGY